MDLQVISTNKQLNTTSAEIGAKCDIFPKPKQGVCHSVALPFTLKSILRQKKNYGNSNISPCKNIIFKKPSKRNQNPSRY
jgi:hypothetical protein